MYSPKAACSTQFCVNIPAVNDKSAKKKKETLELIEDCSYALFAERFYPSASSFW
jgi:hypothetical protein